MKLLCIDPGTTVSGAVVYDTETRGVSFVQPSIPNEKLLQVITTKLCSLERYSSRGVDHMAIEMVASYGMAVGKEVFETVRWVGIFQQAFGLERSTLVYRRDVKLELCGNVRAKDANLRVALFDRFPATGGGATPVRGTKGQPGPLYGVTKHAISALAVGVTWEAMRV